MSAPPSSFIQRAQNFVFSKDFVKYVFMIPDFFFICLQCQQFFFPPYISGVRTAGWWLTPPLWIVINTNDFSRCKITTAILAYVMDFWTSLRW